jgi:hypothetical protein
MRFVFYLIILLLCFCTQAFCRGQVSIRFVPTYEARQVLLEDKWYKTAGGDSLLLETIRFYISDVCFYKEGRVVYKEQGSYHLIDCADEASGGWPVQVADRLVYDAIGFNLGIDSTTNVSGVQGGVLDPATGMYWAWQSGYINFKLEGRSNLCATRKNVFQFHLGGYMLHDYAMQRVLLNTSSKDIVIGLPIDKCLSSIDLRIKNSIMIPCPEAVEMSRRIAKLFEVIEQ